MVLTVGPNALDGLYVYGIKTAWRLGVGLGTKNRKVLPIVTEAHKAIRS